MKDFNAPPNLSTMRTDRVYLGALLAILIIGGYARFEGLGVRSLWRDELCTWHVSRMPLVESMAWGPELTKPPLYQLALRALTSDPQPTETILRFPAAACGLLMVLAGWWLGRMMGGRSVGLALAGLIAFNYLQLTYSQEARPYSMLVLGCAVSTALWYRVVKDGDGRASWAYAAVATLTLHAHYLAALTVGGHFLWWIATLRFRSPKRRKLLPLWVLVSVGILCIPIVVRYLYFRSSMFQGLEWIEPATWSRAIGVLADLTFGTYWVAAMLAPAILLWLMGLCGFSLRRLWQPGGKLFQGVDDPCGLLAIWLLCSWFALIVISWIAHPALVARYALPAAIPAILLPLLMAYRLDRRAPMLILLVFTLVAIPQWSAGRGVRTKPGLRDMFRYVDENIDRESELLVMLIDRTIYPGWEDSERLPFEYYPMRDVPYAEIRLTEDGLRSNDEALRDPRGLYVISLWDDPLPMLTAAGRTIELIHLDGSRFEQLLFTPYRLLHVAPLESNENG